MLAGALVCAGCGGPGRAPRVVMSTSRPAPIVTVEVTAAQNPSLGLILTDVNGMTLYHYMPEKSGQVKCVDSCASLWRPFTVTAQEDPVAGPGVPGRLATTLRPDGERQVTYDGFPLYRYRDDTIPGEASGEGLGGMWTVIQLPSTGTTGVPIHPLDSSSS